jgi:hypothetical protein
VRPLESDTPAEVIDRQQWLEEQANLHLEPFWLETLKRLLPRK